jgi:hypothetical protein
VKLVASRAQGPPFRQQGDAREADDSKSHKWWMSPARSDTFRAKKWPMRSQTRFVFLG